MENDIHTIKMAYQGVRFSVILDLCLLMYIVLLCVNYFSCRMLARSQYPEGPTTGHLGTGFSWFPCVYKRMLGWFPRLHVATACFSCSPPDLNFLDPQFIFMYMHYNHCHRVTAHLQLNTLLLLNSYLLLKKTLVIDLQRMKLECSILRLLLQ